MSISLEANDWKHTALTAGESQAELERSSFLEKLFDRDYEVIYFTDAVDEYVMQHLTEFDNRKLQNAAKENLKLGDKDEKEKKKEKALRVSTFWLIRGLTKPPL